MSTTLAAMMLALASTQDAPAEPPPPPAPETAVETIEITAAPRLRGDMKEGVLTYPPTFFSVTRPSTALDMVTWLPGFTLEDTRDVRGLEGSTGNVLIDGKPPTAKTDTLVSVLRRIPSDQVERVDLIVGGAPGINMRGRNIIANVILKVSPKTPRTVTGQLFVDKEGRASPSIAATLSRKRDDRSLEMGAEFARQVAVSQFFGYGSLIRRDGGGAVVFEADNNFLYGGPFASANLTYERPFAGGRLRVNGLGRFYGTIGDERTTLRSGAGAYRYFHDEDYRQGELGLRYERALGRLNIEAQFLARPSSYVFRDQNDRPPTLLRFDIEGESDERIGRGVLRYKRDETLTLEAFGEAALNTGATLTKAETNGAPQALPTPHLIAEEQRGEVGMALAWKPNATTSLDFAMKGEASTLAVSGDADNERHYAFSKPKLALSWSPDKATQVRLRLEHEVGQVGLFSLTTLPEISGQTRVGNLNLRPSRAFVAEAVVQRRFGVGGDASLTLRRSTLRDSADVAAFPSDLGLLQIFTNISDGRRTDLVAGLTVPLKPLGLVGAMLKGGFTLSDIEVTDPTDGSKRPLSGQPQRIADLHFTQDFPQWRLNWGIDAFYRGETTNYRPFGNETVAAWPRFNVFVERRFDPGYVLRAELLNAPGPVVRQTTSYYPGLRDRTALLYSDEKRLSSGMVLLLRLRRSFE